jgi:uncharacterized protein (TIGR02391 family)
MAAATILSVLGLPNPRDDCQHPLATLVHFLQRIIFALYSPDSRANLVVSRRVSPMLTGDAERYFDTFVRKRRDELLRQRKTDRETVGGGLVNFEDAAKRAGYTGMFKPDCDFIAGQAHAHAEGVQKAYESIGQPLTQEIIDTEIMPHVEGILSSSAAVISRDKHRMESLGRRTGRVDPAASGKLGSLKRHFDRFTHETREAIRNEVTLKMLDAKKENAPSRKGGAVLPAGKYTYHPEVLKVSQQMLLEGNFRGAVLDAFIHLIDTVKQKTGLESKSADDMMNRAFCPDNQVPPVRFNALRTKEEKDEQRGIWLLFKGVVGLRNYTAHKVTPFDDPHRAHEYLALASLLTRLLDNATIQKSE